VKWAKKIKHRARAFAKRFNRQSFKRYLKLSVFVAIFSASLPFLDYVHQNQTESYPSELILLSLFYVLIGLALLATYSLWLKTKGERILATIATTYFFTEFWAGIINNFGFLRGHIGSSKSAVVIPVIVYFAVGFGAKLLRTVEIKIEERKLSEHPLETIAKFACVIIFVLNSFALGTYLQKRHGVDSYKQPTAVDGVSRLTSSKGPKRDIYYFVFDRYASAESLKDNFNFDNSDYLNYLKGSGFTIRGNAFSNYQFTAPSVSSTMRLDYHYDLGKKFANEEPDNYIPYKQLIQDSRAASLLKSAGYDTYNVGNWWDLSRKQKGANNILPEFTATVLGKDFILSELQSQVIDKSFIGGFLRHGISINGHTALKVAHGAPRDIYLQQLNDVKKVVQTPQDKPKFVFAHFLNAHPPYVFGSDGSPPGYDTGDNNNGATRTDKYINQLKFANSSTEELIKTIQSSSKVEPIIIIQADEGPYPLTGVSQWQNASPDTLKLKFGTLGAYSFPGTKSEDAAKIDSSVNIFRFVFNNYFGTDFKYLPDCSYVFNLGGKPFTYYDVTDKLHSEDKACEK
jgi:hypothetical protein